MMIIIMMKYASLLSLLMKGSKLLSFRNKIKSNQQIRTPIFISEISLINCTNTPLFNQFTELNLETITSNQFQDHQESKILSNSKGIKTSNSSSETSTQAWSMEIHYQSTKRKISHNNHENLKITAKEQWLLPNLSNPKVAKQIKPKPESTINKPPVNDTDSKYIEFKAFTKGSIITKATLPMLIRDLKFQHMSKAMITWMLAI